MQPIKILIHLSQSFLWGPEGSKLASVPHKPGKWPLKQFSDKPQISPNSLSVLSEIIMHTNFDFFECFYVLNFVLFV